VAVISRVYLLNSSSVSALGLDTIWSDPGVSIQPVSSRKRERHPTIYSRASFVKNLIAKVLWVSRFPDEGLGSSDGNPVSGGLEQIFREIN
jgi:hypothetical protein